MESQTLPPSKLCPLSFGFSLKQQMPNIIDPKKVDMRIQIGFPCLKEKCAWYQEDPGVCVVWVMFYKLEEISFVKELKK